jgi:hypothetical protein
MHDRRPRSGTLPAAVLLVALCLLPRVAAAQQGSDTSAQAVTADRCRGDEHRKFDFWLGQWEVRNAGGDIVGRSEISRVAGGCALLEDWRGMDGGHGVSINTYDARRERWTQRWVGVGATLWLEGRLEDGEMVLTGTSTRDTPRGDVLDRIVWTPLPDGRVQQAWDVSADDGETWVRSFIGLYTRIP